MKRSGLIDSVPVISPCNEDWAEMSGNAQVPFCSHCAKNVNDLSTMTRKEARKLIVASGGGLCVRYVQHPRTGTPMFASQLVKIAGRAGLAAGVLGASLAAAQPAAAQGTSEPVQIVQANETAANGTTARINGTVLDPNGAIVPFATVSLINKDTGEHRIINADAEGFYQFAELPAGTYTLRAEASGFKTFETTGIKLSDGSLLRTNANLALNQVEEVVQVGGEMSLPQSWTSVTLGVVAVSVVNSNPLVGAVIRDDLDEVKVRVAMRERINVRDRSHQGLTPLHAAVQNGNVEIARFLLERGAKANIRDLDKRTPLMMLDEDATPEMVQLLLSFGAKPKLVDKERNNVLHHAAANGVDSEIIRILVLSGSNVNAVNKEGKTPLMVAAEEGEDEAVAALLSSGADVNRRTRDGRSAMDVASGDQVRDALASFGAARRE